MKQRGFTLLEVLVAIAIFALMYVMAQQFFSQTLQIRDHLADKASQLGQQQRALLFLTQDFEQIIARPVRDKFGDQEPALKGNKETVEFTHLGWANPFSLQQRSHMQRVRYAFYNNQLIRRYWPVLDPNMGTKPVDTVLLDHVKSVEFRYLLHDSTTGKWTWLTRWPSLEASQQPIIVQPLPASVEMTIQLEDGTKLHRYFRLVINPWENSP